MISTPAKVALVTLARNTFDVKFARQILLQTRSLLKSWDWVTLVGPEDLLIDPKDACITGDEIAAQKPDLLIIQNGTFALGNLAVDLAKSVRAPILLWAIPEPSFDGDKLRSNSLVGMNLNSSNLYKIGYKPSYLYGTPEDKETIAGLSQACKVASAIHALQQIKIGLVGDHAIGFYNIAVNQNLLRQQFGVEVERIELQEAFQAAYSLPIDSAAQAKEKLETLYPQRSEISADALERMARQFGGLASLKKKKNLDGLAVRCWPEWANQYGIAACGSVSALNSTGVITGCEGDVDGTVSMFVGQMISQEPTFLTDFIEINYSENTGYFWHGGCAATQLSATKEECSLHSHFASGKGITSGFTFRPGRITVIRISNSGNHYRLFLTTGEALPTEPVVKGVLMKVKFDAPVSKLLDLIVDEGLEHHFCVLYGDWAKAMQLFAKWNDLPILQA